MSILFNSFAEWQETLQESERPIWQPVLEYEIKEKGRTEEDIWSRVATAFAVMKDAVHTGMDEDMKSMSGMIDNGAKKIMACESQCSGGGLQTHVGLHHCCQGS